MHKNIFFLLFLILSQPIFGQRYSEFVPYENETTKLEGFDIDVKVLLALKGDKANLAVQNGIAVITPANPEPANLNDLQLSVSLGLAGGGLKNFLKKYNLILTHESIKSTGQIIYSKEVPRQEIGQDLKEDGLRKATLNFQVYSNGEGEILISYTQTETEREGFNKSGVIAIRYRVKNFLVPEKKYSSLVPEEKEFGDCRTKGLECLCSYAAGNKKHAKQALKIIEERQETEWANAKRRNTKEAYEYYKAKYINCFCIYCDEVDSLVRLIGRENNESAIAGSGSSSPVGSNPPERKRSEPPKSGNPSKPPSSDCQSREKQMIETARREKTISGFQAYLDFIKKCGIKGRFTNEANSAIQELQPIYLEGGISEPDAEGWQTLQFRNVIMPKYSPSPGLEVDDTRFLEELLLKVRFKEGDNYKIVVFDEKFPAKSAFTVDLNNIMQVNLETDSASIILTLDKGSPPFTIKLVNLKNGKEVWQKSGVNPGTTSIDKYKELGKLNGKFQLVIYEQGNAQPFKIEETILLDSGRSTTWLYLIIGSVCVIFFMVMIYLLWKNYRKKQTPWFQNQ